MGAGFTVARLAAPDAAEIVDRMEAVGGGAGLFGLRQHACERLLPQWAIRTLSILKIAHGGHSSLLNASVLRPRGRR